MLTARVDNRSKTGHEVLEFISYKLLQTADGKAATLQYRVGDEIKERLISGGEALFVMNDTGRTIDIFRSKRSQ